MRWALWDVRALLGALGALGMVGALGVAGCSVLVDDEPLTRGCAADEKPCDGRCVSRSDPEYGCGAEICQPCVLPNTMSICDAEEQCAVASCVGNYEDCDLVANNGCEVNLDTDVDHCGGCDAPACNVPGAYAACARGGCAIRKCLPGYRDCNRLDVDGCEVLSRQGSGSTLAVDAGVDSGAADAPVPAQLCEPWALDGAVLR